MLMVKFNIKQKCVCFALNYLLRTLKREQVHTNESIFKNGFAFYVWYSILLWDSILENSEVQDSNRKSQNFSSLWKWKKTTNKQNQSSVSVPLKHLLILPGGDIKHKESTFRILCSCKRVKSCLKNTTIPKCYPY